MMMILSIDTASFFLYPLRQLIIAIIRLYRAKFRPRDPWLISLLGRVQQLSDSAGIAYILRVGILYTLRYIVPSLSQYQHD